MYKYIKCFSTRKIHGNATLYKENFEIAKKYTTFKFNEEAILECINN